MRQSNVIFGTLVFMFIVYITMRGQLPAYLELFKPRPMATGGGGSGGSSGGSSIKDQAIKKGKKYAVDAALAYFGL